MLRLLAMLASLALAPLAPLAPVSVPLDSPTPATPTPEPGHHGNHTSYEEPSVVHAYTYVEEPTAETTLVFDASYLPGETGWFLVPLDAERWTRVEVDASYAFRPERAPSGLALVVARPSDGVFAPSSIVLGADGSFATADAAGARVACCDWPEAEPVLTAGWREHSSEGSPFHAEVGPGATLWVGAVVDGWTDASELRLVVRGWGAPLQMGTVHTGLRAKAVDLVDLAFADGAAIRQGPSVVAGEAGEARFAFDPDATGLLVVSYAAGGEASALLTAKRAGAPLLDEALVRKTSGVLQAAGPGPLRLGLDEVEAGARWPSPDGWLHATALVADVDAPLSGVHAWDERDRLRAWH